MKKIIKEDISKSTNAALVYHRTRSIENVKSMTDNGINAGSRAHYGRGFYSYYNEDSTYKDSTYKSSNHGSIILKCIVTNLRGNFLIFEKNEANKIYGENCKLYEQIPNLPQDCIDYLIKLNEYFDKYETISSTNVWRFTERFSNLLGNQIAGISFFDTKYEGAVLVCYKPKKTDGFLHITGYKKDDEKEYKKLDMIKNLIGVILIRIPQNY
jgi:hypothetical protein